MVLRHLAACAKFDRILQERQFMNLKTTGDEAGKQDEIWPLNIAIHILVDIHGLILRFLL